MRGESSQSVKRQRGVKGGRKTPSRKAESSRIATRPATHLSEDVVKVDSNKRHVYGCVSVEKGKRTRARNEESEKPGGSSGLRQEGFGRRNNAFSSVGLRARASHPCAWTWPS